MLYACEYDSNGMNYHEVIPPEKDVSVTYNLADVPEGNTIYIYSPTSLVYTLNTSSGAIISKEFYINNQQINDEQGKIFLSPDNIPENTTNTLKLKVKLTSGTGSLAEILGGEKSEFEFSYPLKYVNPDVKLNIMQRVSNDNHLELYWEKPEIEGTEIENYKIYNYDNFDEIFIKEITDQNETSYLDKDYVYGSKTFRIVTTYKSKEIAPKEDFYTVKYEDFTSDKFTTSSSESFKLKIKWNNPNTFASKYVLKWENELIYINENVNETSIIRPTFPMPGEQYYELYILPIDADFNEYTKYSKVINYFRESFVGEELGLDLSHIWYAADVKNNFILTMRPNYNPFGFRAHDINDLNTSLNFDMADLSPFYTSEFTTSPTTGRVAIHWRNRDSYGNAKINVYSDYTLKTLLGSFPADDFPVFFLTDDDKIIINNNDRQRNRIYNIKTGALLNNQTETTGTEFRPAISPDGKYVFNYLRISNTWYKLYSYDNGNFNLIKYQINSGVKEIVFNPKNQNHVLMQSSTNNSFSIFEVPSLIKIATIEGEFVRFDPFTGNILYLDKNFENNYQLNILNSSYDKTIFKITTNLNYYYYYSNLMNNNLIVRDYYINITK